MRGRSCRGPAYGKLADPKRVGGPVTLAYCWAHWRRQWFDIAKSPPAPIAAEVLQRIAELYQIEAEIRGQDADERRAVRQQKSKPLIAALRGSLEKTLRQVPSGSSIAQAIRYGSINGRGCCAFSTTAASRSTPIPSSEACARLLSTEKTHFSPVRMKGRKTGQCSPR